MEPRIVYNRQGHRVILRSAVAEDAAALIAYVEATALESRNLSREPGEFSRTMTVEAEAAFLERLENTDTGLYLLAECDGAIAGTLVFTRGQQSRIGHSGHFGMSVRKSHWRTGLGSLLVEGLLQWARAVPSLRRIQLEVLTDNDAAIALYRKFGFEQEGIHKMSFCVDGTYKDTFSMALLLGSETL